MWDPATTVEINQTDSFTGLHSIENTWGLPEKTKLIWWTDGNYSRSTFFVNLIATGFRCIFLLNCLILHAWNQPKYYLTMRLFCLFEDGGFVGCGGYSVGILFLNVLYSLRSMIVSVVPAVSMEMTTRIAWFPRFAFQIIDSYRHSFLQQLV